MDIPEGILCARTHEWVMQDGDIALVGLCDWKVDNLGDIVSIELPEIDSKFVSLESLCIEICLT